MENFINKDNIILDLETENKIEIINKMINTISNRKLVNKEKFLEDVLKREKMENTVVGFKVAIPHGKSEFINSPQIVFAKLKKEIDFFGSKIRIVICLASRNKDEHLRAILELNGYLKNSDFENELLIKKTPEELINYLKSLEISGS